MIEKLSYTEIRRRLNACPVFGTRWRHYKTGNEYVVCGAVIAEATQEPLVLYHAADAEEVVTFARPLPEWNEPLIHKGQLVPRFSRV